MAEEETKQNNLAEIEDKVSSFASGIDASLALRIDKIYLSQEKELERIRHNILIAKTLFEIESKRALAGADERTVAALSKAYWSLDLGDEND